MTTFLLIILSFVTLAMIICILLQQSEGGGLTSGGPAMGGMMSARGAKNLLTHVTAVLATIFMTLCIVLAILSGAGRKSVESSVLDEISQQKPVIPAAPISQ
ncbi:MAG: preprotein translocase subunit SecG [Alphaproteobacteria bacterium RIFCSPLOWO2_01_FULL_45_8]|nr:MAG: preprotein translocase subunit SecG [Alphaproteobacteria bacterium GWB1_45_5]OFW75895.1 MAG: preprotein translocase subunit SecG [Alphaproteobacteria bacterium GWA1_45_9]OFW89987.1 MAG: preprotein translocase subunit SecG [Alphaproteobacteria bacterium RIFCSPHIGHO2_01_FULL_41_14]OFW96010.1 MAG: preprotein translocase subunit SecG [Alphaproteobacteria bacterium RIFCSPLOWO2_01_FULL_45_8]HCI48507.1 preprotein translocase subunit SecG [Holosporales bacterium]